MTTFLFKERARSVSRINYDIVNSNIVIGTATRFNGIADFEVRNSGNNESVLAPATVACKLLFGVTDDLAVVDSQGRNLN